mgnify:CR=1 FL=1
MQILKDIQLEGMQEQGMGDAQIEQAMKMSEAFMTPGAMLAMGLVLGVFFGFLVSLVVSAITKNNNPALEV